MNSKTLQLDNFHKNIKRLEKKYQINYGTDYVYEIAPFGHSFATPKKPIFATFMALVHGNEIGGLGILEAFVDHLLGAELVLEQPIGIVLGNPEAFVQNTRFVSKDLNRCFGVSCPKNSEEKRAQKLGSFLEKSQYLVDFHQTIEATPKGFFIFPYQQKSFAFAQAIHPHLDIITHWGKSFSKEGLCTDEFVNSTNGIGVTLETGQIGADEKQVSLGLKIIENTLALKKLCIPLKAHAGSIYTWSEIIAYPQNGRVKLEPGFTNFMKIKAEQKLADYEKSVIKATADGYILFPKYTSAKTIRPKELCRILKKISLDQLP